MRFIGFRFSLTLLAGALFLLPAPARAQDQATAAGLRRLCESWREDGPPRALWFDVPAPQLQYGGGELQLALSRAMTVEEGPQGLVEIFPGQPILAMAALPVAEGSRLIAAQAAGRLRARIVFLPEHGPITQTPCLLVAGRVTRVRIAPLWVRLFEGLREQARLVTERGADYRIADAGPEKPEVQINPKDLVFSGEAHDAELFGPALQALRERSLGCYQRILQKRPGLAGKVIIGVEVDRDGRLSDGHVEVDAAGDLGLSRCLTSTLLTAKLHKPQHPGHLSVPITLRLK